MLIALLGAECTGKSTLGLQLAAALDAAYVPEALRDWCLREGRTPQAAEQAAIAAEQQRRIEAAARACVVADTTPLMTAVYSQHYFDDDTLLPAALAWQRRASLTLLCTPDGVAWEPAGLLRDGDAARQQVHQRLLALLEREQLSYSPLRGDLDNRLRTALSLIPR